MVVTSPGRLFVCGTNSFRPMCNTYIINDNNYTLEATKNGQAVCPYDPRHNSTSVFAGKFLNLFTFHCWPYFAINCDINKNNFLLKKCFIYKQQTNNNLI